MPRPPAEIVTPETIEEIRIELHRLAKAKNARMSLISGLATAETYTENDVEIEDVLADLARGDEVSAIMRRRHLSRWAVERIRAGEGQG